LRKGLKQKLDLAATEQLMLVERNSEAPNFIFSSSSAEFYKQK